MKIAIWLYRHMLTPEYFSFARPAGFTDVVVHLTDYFRGKAENARNNQPIGGNCKPWGVAPCHAGMVHTIGFMAAVPADQKKREVSSALGTIR